MHTKRLFLGFLLVFVSLILPSGLQAQEPPPGGQFFCKWGINPSNGQAGCYMELDEYGEPTGNECETNYTYDCSQFQSPVECTNTEHQCSPNLPETPPDEPPPDEQDPGEPTECYPGRCTTDSDCGGTKCEGSTGDSCTGFCSCVSGRCNTHTDCSGWSGVCKDRTEGQWCSGNCFQSDEDLKPYWFEGFCESKINGKVIGIETFIGCIPIFESMQETNQFLYLRGAAIAGGIAFLMMIFSGFQMVTSRGEPEKYVSAKNLFTAAVAGLIVVIFSAFILRAITVNIFGLFN